MLSVGRSWRRHRMASVSVSPPRFGLASAGLPRTGHHEMGTCRRSWPPGPAPAACAADASAEVARIVEPIKSRARVLIRYLPDVLGRHPKPYSLVAPRSTGGQYLLHNLFE